jgi:hypothetical protein
MYAGVQSKNHVLHNINKFQNLFIRCLDFEKFYFNEIRYILYFYYMHFRFHEKLRLNKFVIVKIPFSIMCSSMRHVIFVICRKLDLVPLQSKFFPPNFSFAFWKREFLAGKNLFGKRANLLCKEGFSKF